MSRVAARARGTLVLFVLVLGFGTPAFVAPTPVLGETGMVYGLASRNTVTPSPWRVTFDTSWVESNGYRPVKFTITPQPPIVVPTKRSYSVRVEFQPWSYYLHSRGVTVSKEFEVPQGSTGITENVLIPVDGFWQSIRVAVYVDGVELDDMASQFGVVVPNAAWNELAPTVLIIDFDAPPVGVPRVAMPAMGAVTGKPDPTSEKPENRLPNIGELVPAINGLVNSSPGLVTLPNGTAVPLASAKLANPTDDEIIAFARMSPRLALVHPTSLDEQWLSLTSCSIIMISLDDLRRMKQEFPDQFRAMRRCVATGHALCVWDIGESFERLTGLERLLDMPSLPADAPGGWLRPKPETERRDYSELVSSADQMTAFYQSPQGGVISRPAAQTTNRPAPDAGKRRPPGWLRVRPLAFGQVVAMGPQDPFPGTPADWNYVLAAIGEETWQWHLRHGMTLAGNNPGFHEFAIANVGRPPIFTFLTLITVFALVIGPVNYIWLSRKRRLYLLLVTVPLGAGLVTLSLLLYAVISDGLHTRHRVRSVTYVDQKGGDVINLSRQTYFAGIAPGRGMRFPLETAVYPLHRWWISSDVPRDVNWDDHLQLSRGYLSSRTITQFVTVRARENPYKLTITGANRPDGELSATNQLGTTARFLVVCDRQGQLRYTEHLLDTDNATLKPIDVTSLVAKMRDYIVERDKYEVGYSAFDEQTPRALLRYWRPTSIAQVTQGTTGLLGKMLSHWDLVHFPLAPGEFLAIVPHAPEVPVGVPKVYEEGSAHLIFGNW